MKQILLTFIMSFLFLKVNSQNQSRILAVSAFVHKVSWISNWSTQWGSSTG